MFCIKCGAQNSGGSTFCIRCGNPLQSAPQQAPVQQHAPVQQAPVQQGGYYANTGATPPPQLGYYTPGYGAAKQAPSMTMTAKRPNYKLIGIITVAVVAVIVVAVILIFVVGSNPLIGTWEYVDYGNEITFNADGTVETLLAAFDTATYKVRGNTVIFTFPDGDFTKWTFKIGKMLGKSYLELTRDDGFTTETMIKTS
jgi:uncharacterized membrane protein YvbJ